MGFFERKLGSLGEAMDDGVDRARVHARDLCDRQGWSDRAETVRDRAGSLRERVGERAAEQRRELAGRWAELGSEARKRVYVGAGVLGLILLTLLVRAVVFRGPPMPSAEELALVDSLRSRAPRSPQWISTGGSGDPIVLFHRDD